MEKSHAEKTPPVNRSNAEGDGKSPIQTKLTVGPSNDKYEKEADNMADRVVNDQTSAVSPTASSISPLAQRQEEKDEEASTKLQQKEEEEEAAQPKLQRQEEEGTSESAEEEEESSAQGKIQKMEDEKDEGQPKLQRQEDKEETAMTKPDTSGKKVMNKKIERRIKSKKGGGSPMPVKVRSFMEKKFGADFSKIKIHDDSESHDLCKQLKAQAFTVGRDIYFAKGKFDPDSKSGRHLLAHELTHTIQQKGKH